MNLRKLVMPLLGYLLLISLIVYPFWTNFTAAVIGGGGDIFQFTWSFWHFKNALLQLNNPFITDLIFYPLEINLILHVCTPTKSVIAVILQILGFNTIASYNSLVVYTYVMAGLGAYLLILSYIPDRKIAFVGGLIYAFAPNQLAHTLGHLNVISIEAIPWLVYVWRSHVQRPRIWKTIILSWLSIYLFFCDYQLFLYTIILVSLYLLSYFLNNFQDALTKFKLMAPVGIIFLLIMTPFWIMAATALKKYNLMAIHGHGWGAAEHYYMDLVSIIIPSETHFLWGNMVKKFNAIFNISPFSNESERTAFMGISVLTIFGIGIRKNWDNVNVRFWLLIALVFLFFSFGPILHFFGMPINAMSGFHLFSFDGIKVLFPMPYTIIHYLPVFNGARIPSRFIVMTSLAVAIMFSIFLYNFLAQKQWSQYKRNLFLLGLVLIIAFEYWPQSFFHGEVKIPSVYQIIAQDKDKDHVVLDMPSAPWAYDLHMHHFQISHGHKMVGGFTARFSKDQEDYIKKYASTMTMLHAGKEVKHQQFYEMADELNIHYIVARNNKTIKAIGAIADNSLRIVKISEDQKLGVCLWRIKQ